MLLSETSWNHAIQRRHGDKGQTNTEHVPKGCQITGNPETSHQYFNCTQKTQHLPEFDK